MFKKGDVLLENEPLDPYRLEIMGVHPHCSYDVEVISGAMEG